MNLIEQLGGYSAAKAHVLELVSDYGEGVTNKTKLYDFQFNVGQVKKALLEYRRQHNIFEVGDKIVHPKFGDKNIYEILEIRNDLFTVYCFRQSHSFKSDVRHATPEEIAAGHRL